MKQLYRATHIARSGGQGLKELAFRRELIELVTSSVLTHFKLIGPAGCSAEQTQRALRLAARVLVRENLGHCGGHIVRSHICPSVTTREWYVK